MVNRCTCGDMEFRFFRREVKQVFLVGDFNGWHKSAFPMISTGGGWWVYRLRLAPGSYQFQYLTDGNWYLDFAAFGVEHGPFGWNSVVLVDHHDRPANRTNDDETLFTTSGRARKQQILAGTGDCGLGTGVKPRGEGRGIEAATEEVLEARKHARKTHTSCWVSD